MIQKKCKWCDGDFTPEHGNGTYCCPEHEDEAKKARQKKKRDPIARFFPILIKNHETLDELFGEGKTDLTIVEIEDYKIDITLCHHKKPPLGQQGKLEMDFGVYSLLPDSNFQNFKLISHENTTAVQSR